MSDERSVTAGYYKGRGVAGSAQYGLGDKGEQIAIDVTVPSLNRTFTTFLSFSEKAWPYAIERLRACGWMGDDITNLTDLDKNEVDVQIHYETWKGKERMKVEIATGGGRVTLENTLDERQKRAFAARMKPLLAGSAITAQRMQGGQSHAPSGPPARAPATTNRREGAFDPGPPGDDDIPF